MQNVFIISMMGSVLVGAICDASVGGTISLSSAVYLAVASTVLSGVHLAMLNSFGKMNFAAWLIITEGRILSIAFGVCPWYVFRFGCLSQDSIWVSLRTIVKLQD